MLHSRVVALALLLCITLIALPACESGGSSFDAPEVATGDPDGAVPRGWFDDEGEAPPAPAARNRGNPGTTARTGTNTRPRTRGNARAGVRVTWQALAHERYLAENPRIGRQPLAAARRENTIVLVNESHPDADGIRSLSFRREDGVGQGVISDAQMRTLLAGLEEVGYFKAARDTSAMAQLFGADIARGRVTVERGGRSVSLISMRGQGRSEHTKHIPAIYSQAKQAVAMLRNQSPTLTVETSGPSDQRR
jgi:hypothetical protein